MEMIGRRGILRAGLAAIGAKAVSWPNIVTAASPEYGIMEQVAPELQVDYWIDENGEPTTFRLADHKNKWVVLKCFQSWCLGCHSHGFPALKLMSDALGDNPNVVFAGIQTVFEGHFTNTVDKVRSIQQQYDLRLPMGHDAGADGNSPITMLQYRTGGTPWFIVIDPERQVVFNDYGIDAQKAIAFLEQQTA